MHDVRAPAWLRAPPALLRVAGSHGCRLDDCQNHTAGHGVRVHPFYADAPCTIDLDNCGHRASRAHAANGWRSIYVVGARYECFSCAAAFSLTSRDSVIGFLNKGAVLCDDCIQPHANAR